MFVETTIANLRSLIPQRLMKSLVLNVSLLSGILNCSVVAWLSIHAIQPLCAIKEKYGGIVVPSFEVTSQFQSIRHQTLHECST